MSVQSLFATINEAAKTEEYEEDLDDLAELSEPDQPTAEQKDEESSATSPQETADSVAVAPYRPVIIGKDAELLTVNSDSGAIEPKPGSEIAVIGLKDQLDAYVLVPGANFARQLSWDPASNKIREQREGKQISIAPANDAEIDFSKLTIVKPADNLDRVKRITAMPKEPEVQDDPTPKKAEQVSDDEPGPIPELNNDDDATEDSVDTANRQGAAGFPPEMDPGHAGPTGMTRRGELLSQYGPGGAVAMGLIGGAIDGTMYAADRTVRLAGKLTSDGVKGTIKTCQEVIDQLKARSQRLNEVTQANQSKITDLNLKSGPSLADLDGPGELSSVVNKVVDGSDMQERVSELQIADTSSQAWLSNIKEGFGKAFNSQLDIVHKAMNLDDINAPSSPEEFDAALADLPDEHREAVTGAIDKMKKNCEKLGEQLGDWLNDKKGSKFSTMTLEDRKEAVETIEEWTQDPSKLADPKYKDLIDNLGTEGKTFKDQISGVFDGLRSMIDRIMTKLKTLIGVQEQAHEVHQEESQNTGMRMG